MHARINSLFVATIGTLAISFGLQGSAWAPEHRTIDALTTYEADRTTSDGPSITSKHTSDTETPQKGEHVVEAKDKTSENIDTRKLTTVSKEPDSEIDPIPITIKLGEAAGYGMIAGLAISGLRRRILRWRAYCSEHSLERSNLPNSSFNNLHWKHVLKEAIHVVGYLLILAAILAKLLLESL